MSDNTIDFFVSLNDSINLGYIVEQCKEKWGDDIDLENINLEMDERKERGCSCCYDSSDYDYYLVASLIS